MTFKELADPPRATEQMLQRRSGQDAQQLITFFLQASRTKLHAPLALLQLVHQLYGDAQPDLQQQQAHELQVSLKELALRMENPNTGVKRSWHFAG